MNEPRKIILAVTDGYPDSKALARNAILTARAVGYEVYGIGDRTGDHEECLDALIFNHFAEPCGF
jgi:hypothetical protein